jgi:hypothetical protein
MDVASMGWIAEGMGRLTPAEAGNVFAAGGAEDFLEADEADLGGAVGETNCFSFSLAALSCFGDSIGSDFAVVTSFVFF